jgi:hypothetical protein
MQGNLNATPAAIEAAVEREKNSILLAVLSVKDLLGYNGAAIKPRFVSGKTNPADYLTKPGDVEYGLLRRVLAVTVACKIASGELPEEIAGVEV